MFVQVMVGDKMQTQHLLTSIQLLTENVSVDRTKFTFLVIRSNTMSNTTVDCNITQHI